MARLIRWIVYFKKTDSCGRAQPWNEGFNAQTAEEAMEMCRQKNGNAESAIPAYQAAIPIYCSYGSGSKQNNRRYGKWQAPNKQ